MQKTKTKYARLATNYWTDTRIFEEFEQKIPVRVDAEILSAFLEFWKLDKESGFYCFDEPERSAAQAGNYGAYLERLINNARNKGGTPNKTQKEKRAGLRPMTTQAYNKLAKWYSPQRLPIFINATNEIYSALEQGECDKDIARRISEIYNKIDVPQYDKECNRHERPDWKKFLPDMAAAYGVEITYYAKSKL